MNLVSYARELLTQAISHKKEQCAECGDYKRNTDMISHMHGYLCREGECYGKYISGRGFSRIHEELNRI